MILTFKDTPHYDKIKAIKAVRALMGLGLKEAKDFVEAAVEHGHCEDYDKVPYVHNTEQYNILKSVGFSLLDDDTVLIDALNHALDVATEQRKYTIVRLVLDAIDVATDGHYIPHSICSPTA